MCKLPQDPPVKNRKMEKKLNLGKHEKDKIYRGTDHQDSQRTGSWTDCLIHLQVVRDTPGNILQLEE